MLLCNSWPLLKGDQVSISLFLCRNILYRPVLGGPRAFVYVCIVAVGTTCPMLLAAIYAFCTLLSSFRLAFFKTFAAHSIPWVFDGYHKSWPPLLQILSGHELRVRDIAFSPDGTRIASGSLDLTVGSGMCLRASYSLDLCK